MGQVFRQTHVASLAAPPGVRFPTVRKISIGCVCALAACTALMTGCGGGGSDKRAGPSGSTGAVESPRIRGPKPAETPEQAVARIAKAAIAGDCDHFRGIFRKEEMTKELCSKVLPDIEPVLPPEVKAFGSGAVVKNADGGTTILTLDHDRRFKQTFSFAGGGRDAHLPVEKAVDAMGFVTSAMRRDNCDDIVRISLTFRQITGDKFCATPGVRRLSKAFQRDLDAEPELLGGDGTYAFYGVRVKPHRYFTLVFVAHPSGTYLFVAGDEA